MDTLELITSDIKVCQRCELRASATRPVPGLGNVGAKYFLLGEAPGVSEDAAGIPFCGAAGRKLDALIRLAKIDPNEVYFANVCRCRPPQNRTPKKKEITACMAFLWRELLLVKPTYVVTLGATPLSLFCDYGVSTTHGTLLDIEIPDTLEDIIAWANPKKKNGGKLEVQTD